MDPGVGIKPMAQRKYDIVVVGATGVTGYLVSKHLATIAPRITWAVGGRSEDKLKKLKQSLPAVPGVNKPDIIVLDVIHDPESKIKSILEDTRVVINLVGPYSYWGEKALKPCVEAGTAWVDINGEVPWAREMGEKYQKLAEQTKAVVVSCCGYDSVPSDMGIFLLSRYVGGELGRVDSVAEEVVGEASFGTLSSLLAPYYVYPSDKILHPNGYHSDPYVLYPGDKRDRDTLPVQSTEVSVKRASSNIVYHAPLKHAKVQSPKQHGGYLIPSVPFEVINRPVVMRSYGLRSSVDDQGRRTHDSYGKNFKYREWMLLPPGMLTRLLSFPMAYFFTTLMPLCLSFSPIRGITKFFFEKVFGPGFGPAPDLQERGGFRWKIIGEAIGHEPRNERAVLQMEGRRDVGYGWTSVIISEIALYLVDKLRGRDGTVSMSTREIGGRTAPLVKQLVEQGEKGENDDIIFGWRDGEGRKGGFWTTACLGMGLVHRLLISGFLDVEMRWMVDQDIPVEAKKTV